MRTYAIIREAKWRKEKKNYRKKLKYKILVYIY